MPRVVRWPLVQRREFTLYVEGGAGADTVLPVRSDGAATGIEGTTRTHDDVAFGVEDEGAVLGLDGREASGPDHVSTMPVAGAKDDASTFIDSESNVLWRKKGPHCTVACGPVGRCDFHLRVCNRRCGGVRSGTSRSAPGFLRTRREGGAERNEDWKSRG